MKTRLISLIIKEFLAIFKDPKSRMLIIVPSLLQLIIFANAMTMEVKNVDMAILDSSNTTLSRNLTSRFVHSRWFRKVYFVQTPEQIKEKIENQEVQLALEIQNNFDTQIKRHKQTPIQVIVDGRQTNSAAIASGYATRIISEFDNEIANKKGASVNFAVRNMYNPNLEYQWYTLVCLITLLSFVVTLMLTALSIAREREIGTFEQIIVSPLSPVEILIGKTIPPVISALGLTLFMIVATRIFFHLPFEGNVFVLLCATFVSLLAATGIGLFISSVCKTQQQAILYCFTFQMPAVLLSGFISPIQDMPVFFQYLTLLNPLRFQMVITKALFLKGMLIQDVLYNMIPLAIIALITLSAATRMFKRTLD